MRYSVPVAYFLWLISGFGALGFHRFYLGKTATGILWMMTGGLAMMGSVYDALTLSRQVDNANMRAAWEAGQIGGQTVLRPAAPSLEKTILLVAKRNKGVVSPGEVALEADCGLEEAKKALEKLAAAGNAEMRVRSSGVVVFVLPDFAGGNEDFVV